MDEKLKEYLNLEKLKAKSLIYATNKHMNQKRKYTDEDYINHPLEVALKILEYMKNENFSDKECTIMYCSAILHDTVEDTSATIEEIETFAGKEIADIVNWLTNVSKPEDGNRKIRKMKDLEHIMSAPLPAICIKIADVICNCKGMVEVDRKYSNGEFCKKYIPEKMIFYNFLTKLKIPYDLNLTQYEIIFYKMLKELKEVLNKELELLNYT